MVFAVDVQQATPASSLLAGFIAGSFGLTPTFLIAAAAMLLGVASSRRRPLIDTRGQDRGAAVYWPEPTLAVEVGPELGPELGPVFVSNTYTIAAEDERRFVQAMEHVRLSRLRTGATRWGLFRDGEAPRRFVELFVVP